MLGRVIISLILFFCLLSVERRANAPLNGELLRQRLAGRRQKASPNNPLEQNAA